MGEPMSNNPSIFPFMLTSKPHSKKKQSFKKTKPPRKKTYNPTIKSTLSKKKEKKVILPKDLLFPRKILTDQEKKQKPLPLRKNMLILVVLNNATLCIPRKGLVVDRSAMIKMPLRSGRRSIIKSSILSKIH